MSLKNPRLMILGYNFTKLSAFLGHYASSPKQLCQVCKAIVPEVNSIVPE